MIASSHAGRDMISWPADRSYQLRPKRKEVFP
jgi:hypothetical protein